jgi:hypothetical protein
VGCGRDAQVFADRLDVAFRRVFPSSVSNTDDLLPPY